MGEKINKSFLTEEAKSDINEMLDNNSGGGGSSFTTQIETSEGLTLGKGTENEENLSAQELTDIKNGGTSGKLIKTHFESNTTVIASIPSGLNPRSVQIDLTHITGLKPNTDYFCLWYANPISANYMTCNMESYLLLHTDENGNLLDNLAQDHTKPLVSVLFYNPGNAISNAPIQIGLVIFEHTFTS